MRVTTLLLQARQRKINWLNLSGRWIEWYSEGLSLNYTKQRCSNLRKMIVLPQRHSCWFNHTSIQ